MSVIFIEELAIWISWEVPAERCIVAKLGDVIKVNDIEVVVTDSFDRTCLVTTDDTSENREELTGICPMDMDEKTGNYLLNSDGQFLTVHRFYSPNDSPQAQ